MQKRKRRNLCAYLKVRCLSVCLSVFQNKCVQHGIVLAREERVKIEEDAEEPATEDIFLDLEE